MRHPYTPIFKEITTSSVWALAPSIRCVWFWLLLNADPEGYVPATLPGLAIAANVSLAEAKKAIKLFEAPDEHSKTKALEGRRLVPVEGGWHIVNFVDWRNRAKHE